jgi:hypothetical protein
MSSASSPVPKDHPLMVAWRAYLSTEDFANTRRWVDEGDESAVDGSLWAAFEQGWRAAGGLRPFEDRPRPEWIERFAWLSHPDVMQTIAEDPSVIISVQRGIRELLHQVDFWKDGETAQAHAAIKAERDLLLMRQNEEEQFENLSDALSGGNAATWAEIEHAAHALVERNRELRAELESAADRESARVVEAHDRRDLGQRVAALEAALRGFYDGECHCAVSAGRCVQCVAAAALGVTPDAPGGTR